MVTVNTEYVLKGKPSAAVYPVKMSSDQEEIEQTHEDVTVLMKM